MLEATKKLINNEVISSNGMASILMLDLASDEVKEINAAAFKKGFAANDGKMNVFGQIGVDNCVCPENCTYCSFSIDVFKENNSEKASLKQAILEHNKSAVINLEGLQDHLESFDEAGVDAVSLMATAALPFDRYLEMVKLARATLSSSIGVIVNYRDMEKEELAQLKEAGATCVYHAIRVHEGVITGIGSEKRKETIKLAQEVGFDLMNGVEPIWEPFDSNLALDVAETIIEAASFKPWATGSCALCKVPGSNFYGATPKPERVQLVASVLRLVCGSDTKVGCVGGVMWVDAGEDPRVRGYRDSREKICLEVSKAREKMQTRGWKSNS